MMPNSKRPRPSSSSSELARRKAFADATAGVIGSLASVLAFYPVDVWKTSLQAGVGGVVASAKGEEGDDGMGSSCSSSNGPILSTTLAKLFRGLPHKIAHTIVSSFTYFYVYSLVQTKYATYRNQLGGAANARRGGAITKKTTTSTATKLLLTAFSAVINTCITLPLDTISSRKQAGTSRAARSHNCDNREGGRLSEISSYEKLNGASNNNSSGACDGGFQSAHCSSSSLSEDYQSANEDEGEEHRNEDENIRTERNIQLVGKQQEQHLLQQPSTQQGRQSLYIKSPEKYKFSFSTNLAQEAFATSSTISNTKATGTTVMQQQNLQKQKLQQVQSILSLWNGLIPAILLCTNPAIQYTMYDTLKNALLQHRLDMSSVRNEKARQGQPSSQQNQESQQTVTASKLSMWEAFVFGLISKFFATIVTYPLIRCKVMLMVSPPEAFVKDENDNKQTGKDKDGDTNTMNCCNGTVNNGQPTKQKLQHQTLSPATSAAPTTTTNQNQSNNKKYPRSLLLLLIHIFRKDGIRGIYKGCSLQLLHTILKSALLMMVREKITAASHGFFGVGNE